MAKNNKATTLLFTALHYKIRHENNSNNRLFAITKTEIPKGFPAVAFLTLGTTEMIENYDFCTSVNRRRSL